MKVGDSDPASSQDLKPIKLKNHSFCSALGFYIRSSCKEVKRRKLYFCLAVSSILMVVMTTAVAQTVIDFTPLIFLRTSESDAGSWDVLIEPMTVGFNENDGYDRDYVFKQLRLNGTAIRSIVDEIYPGQTAPRTRLDGQVIDLNQQSGTACEKEIPYQDCLRYTIRLTIQDSATENDLQVGRGLDLPEEIPEGMVVMAQRLADTMDVSAGNDVVLEFVLNGILTDMCIQYNFQQPDQDKRFDCNELNNGFNNLTVYMPVTIHEVKSNMFGKFPDGSYNEMILFEEKFFANHLSKHLPQAYKNLSMYEEFKQFVSEQRAQEYSNRVIFNMRDRLKKYQTTDFDGLQDQVTGFASKISDRLGVFPYEMTLPVYEVLYGLRFGSLFLGITLNIIVFVLFLLSLILVYNLLMVTVETRTFEVGVMRMVGLSKRGIIELIFIQTMTFTLPGILIGFMLAFPLLMMIGNLLSGSLDSVIPPHPSGNATAYSLFIGLAIPVISAYYPLKEALSKNLNLALDLVHSKTSSVSIKVELDINKIPWTQITFGVMTVIFGVCIYIFIPLSLLTFDVALLLTVFFGILIGLILGLTLISINFQHLMERFITSIFFFWTGSAFRTVIVKNLVAHKLRNRKTALMYALSLGFVLFLNVTLNLELNNLSYQTQQQRGALLQITHQNRDNYVDTNLIEQHIRNELSEYIEGYALISQDIEDFLTTKGYQDQRITHRGKLFLQSGNIRAVSPQYFDVSLNEYLFINEFDDTGLSPAEILYTPRGMQGCIIGTYYAEFLDLSLDPEEPLVILLQDGTESRTEYLQVLGIMDAAPGFFFTKVPSFRRPQEILVSFPTYMRLAGPNVITSPAQVPIVEVSIKVKDDRDDYKDIVVQSFIDFRAEQYPSIDIFDYRDFESTVSDNRATLSVVFIAIEIVVLILSLFSLITSMSTNIVEQAKEIAILRAVGLTKLKVVLIYLGESFVLVFSSSLFGILIGTITAFTMSIQRVLFTQLPLRFYFPIVDLVVVLFGALFSSIFSTLFPAIKLVRNNISKMVREGA